MKDNPILYPSKQKYISDYYPRCLISSGLMFDEIIISIIIKKALECHLEGVDSYFTKIEKNRTYMYRGSLQFFYWKKGTPESLDVACIHFNVERIKMRQHLNNILKYDTSINDNKEKINHWLNSLEKFHQNYMIIPTEPYSYSFTKESRYIAGRSPPCFINKETETIFYFNVNIQLLY